MVAELFGCLDLYIVLICFGFVCPKAVELFLLMIHGAGFLMLSTIPPGHYLQTHPLMVVSKVSWKGCKLTKIGFEWPLS